MGVMSAETVAHVIQLILAPSVLMTTCGMMLNAGMGHYFGLNERLRAFARERRELLVALRADRAADLAEERLVELDLETPELLRRHHHVRNAILALWAAVLTYIASAFAIALAAATGHEAAATGALFVFLLGAACQAAGVVQVLLDLRVSHRAVQFEVRHSLGLPAPRSVEPAAPLSKWRAS